MSQRRPGRHLLDGRENQRLTEFAGSAAISFPSAALHLMPPTSHPLVGAEEAISATAFRDLPAESRVAAMLPAAVDRNAPRDPRQPRLRIFDLAEFRAVTQHPQERFLCALRRRDGGEVRRKRCDRRPRVLANQPFEYSTRCPCCDRPSLLRQDRFSRHHSSALNHEDRVESGLFRNFWRENVREACLRSPGVLSFRAPCFWREESAVWWQASGFLAPLRMTSM